MTLIVLPGRRARHNPPWFPSSYYFFIFCCSLFRQILKRERERGERVIYHGSLLFLHLRCSKDFGGFKASDRHEQGHIIPIQMIALLFLVTLERWKWFDMETRLTCSIFAMLSGSLTRTLGSCSNKGIGRFHFLSVALVSLLAPQTQQNSGTMTSKSQLICSTSITSSLKAS